MAIRQKLEDDVKAAMLAGDSHRVETLRGLKTAILYSDIATKTRDSGGIDDEAVLTLFAKEAKKRQESANLYVQGGSQARADKELAEKKMIEAYLPTQMSEAEVAALVGKVIAEQHAEGMQAMGKVISAVKSKVGNSADGSLVAKLVKERLSA